VICCVFWWFSVVFNRRLFEAGLNVFQISKKVAASRWTVTRDLETMDLARFSDISDYDLDELVAGE